MSTRARPDQTDSSKCGFILIGRSSWVMADRIIRISSGQSRDRDSNKYTQGTWITLSTGDKMFSPRTPDTIMRRIVRALRK